VLGRETLHLFPAEVNAAKFEARIPKDLNVPARELHNEVVLQLENIEQFRMFVRAWVYGVIGRDRDEKGGTYLHYYSLKLPEENLSQRLFGEQRELKVHLTTAEQGKPNLLQALETFQYIGKDIRYDKEERIPYDRMQRAIEDAKNMAVSRRLEQELAIDKPIQTHLVNLPPADQERARKLLGERDILKARQDEVHKDLMDMSNSVQIRDVATVFWLALEDEIRSVQEAIVSLLEASRGVR
jgi:hypothetical protein